MEPRIFSLYCPVSEAIWDCIIIKICMLNAFVVDGRHGVKVYLRKLKGVIMRNFFFIGASRNSFLDGVFM